MEAKKDERQYEAEDLELLKKINEIIGDEAKSKQVLNEVLSWLDKQFRVGYTDRSRHYRPPTKIIFSSCII